MLCQQCWTPNPVLQDSRCECCHLFQNDLIYPEQESSFEIPSSGFEHVDLCSPPEEECPSSPEWDGHGFVHENEIKSQPTPEKTTLPCCSYASILNQMLEEGKHLGSLGEREYVHRAAVRMLYEAQEGETPEEKAKAMSLYTRVTTLLLSKINPL